MIFQFMKTGSTTPYIVKGIAAYGSEWHPVKPNQVNTMGLDGTFSCLDLGPTFIKGSLLIKNSSMANGTSLLDFFETVVNFKQNSFSISQKKTETENFVSGQGVDLGRGKGVTVENVYLDIDDRSPSLEKIFDFVAPGYYNIVLPYFYRR